MTHERPRSLTGRMRSLIHGIFAVWVKDSERQNPRAVYEEAINQRTRQYRELKEAVAGVCHARGANADLPSQWLIYITVEDLDQSLADCEELGGEVLVQPRRMGEDRFCVIKDPAGAVCALYESASEH